MTWERTRLRIPYMGEPSLEGRGETGYEAGKTERQSCRTGILGLRNQVCHSGEEEFTQSVESESRYGKVGTDIFFS